MKLNKEDLIKEFHKSLAQTEYSNISLDRLTKIINSFFDFIKDCIQDDNFNTIRIKYFGKFAPLPGKVVGFYRYNIRRLEEGKLTQTEFEQKTNNIIKYIKENPDEFKKFKILL